MRAIGGLSAGQEQAEAGFWLAGKHHPGGDAQRGRKVL